MQKIIKSCAFLLLFALILLFPVLSFSYAAAGLHLWFERMVPTLLPFMILSTLMIRQNLSETFVSLVYPLFGKLYKISKNCVYCILLGFLCGFPMGARTVAEMYERRGISKGEASFLLAFCNNIGPVYYISFLLPVTALFTPKKLPFLLFGMYGLPLLYGLFLRFSGFGLPAGGIDCGGQPNKTSTERFSVSLDHAMQGAVNGITILGGYMILCNLLNLIPHALTLMCKWQVSEKTLAGINCLLEITSGISRVGHSAPLFILSILPLGGLSCLAQTASILQNTDLSMKNYVFHKCMQCLIAFTYYFLLRDFLF